MAELMLEAISKLNENQVPHLGTCTLVVGDGTVKVAFANGRAQVPASVADLVERHPHVDIIRPLLEGVTLPADGVERAVDIVGTDVNPLANATELSTERVEPEVEAEVEAEVSDEVKAAIEHLAADGEAIPDPAPPAVTVDRSGFEPLTVDGQSARCQAAKGDGAQCNNAAVDGPACAIGKHKEQLAG